MHVGATQRLTRPMVGETLPAVPANAAQETGAAELHRPASARPSPVTSNAVPVDINHRLPAPHRSEDSLEPIAKNAPAAVRGVWKQHGALSARPVIYQLFVRTFGNVKGKNRYDGSEKVNGVGKFNDINDAALDSIKKLGVTDIWLTGVLRQATSTDYSALGLPPDDPDVIKGRAGSPYAVRDYYDVCPDYATDPKQRLAQFKALVDRIHKHGMKVIIDFVPNHVARGYHSVIEPGEDFGTHDDQSKFFSPQNNFFYLQSHPGRPLTLDESPRWIPPGHPDEHFAPEDGTPGHTVRMTGNRAAYEVTDNDWKDVVKLNYGYNPRTGQKCFTPMPDTWKKMDHVLAYWQKLGVDGFRCDYAHVVPVEFWRWAIGRARARNPKVMFTAEAYENAPDKIPGFHLTDLLDAGFNSVYDDQLHDGLRQVILGPKWANDITGWLEKYASDDKGMVRYLENHDEVRINAPLRPNDPNDSGMGSMWAGRPMAVVAHLATRGPNLLYNGEEVGEPAKGKEGFGGDDGRTTIFDYWKMPHLAAWVGADHSYQGKNLTPGERALRSFYAKLFTLSREEPFADGKRYIVQWFNAGKKDYGTGQYLYSFLRYDDQGHRVLVVANFSADKTLTPTVRIPPEALAAMGVAKDAVLRLHGELGSPPPAAAARAGALVDQGLHLKLEPFGVSVIDLDDAPAGSAAHAAAATAGQPSKAVA